MYYLKKMNSITLQNKLLTFPKEFACNPSFTAEVLINFMRESQMLLSLSLTLGCSKNRFTSRQRADLTFLGKTSSRKEPGFLTCLVLGKTGLSPSLIAEHFPGTITDFTACNLPPPLAFTYDLLPKSDNVVLFYFIYIHMSKSLFIYLPLLQTTFYVPHPRTELLWHHFIKKDVTGHIYASITPHL